MRWNFLHFIAQTLRIFGAASREGADENLGHKESPLGSGLPAASRDM